MIKQILPLITLLFFSLSWAQTDVSTYELDGKTYFVYPYHHVAKSNKMPKSVKTFDDFKALMKNAVEDQGEADKMLSPDQVEQRKVILKSTLERLDKQKKQITELIHVMQQYEGPIFKSKFSLTKDIAPSLDPIPDGDYIQFYRANEFENYYDTTIVAGIFKIKNNVLEGEGTWFYSNGDLALKGNYKNGFKNGPWIYTKRKYAEPKMTRKELESAEEQNITLKVDSVYAKFENGYKNGFYYSFENGHIEYSGNYKKGTANGEWITYKHPSDTVLIAYQIKRDSLTKRHQSFARSYASAGLSFTQNDSIKYKPHFDLFDYIVFNQPSDYTNLRISYDFAVRRSNKIKIDNELSKRFFQETGGFRIDAQTDIVIK